LNRALSPAPAAQAWAPKRKALVVRAAVRVALRDAHVGAANPPAALFHDILPVLRGASSGSFGGNLCSSISFGIGLLAGTVIGAAAVTGLHAQAKSPVFLITEIDISDPEGYGNEFVPKAQAIKAFGAKFLATGGIGGAAAKPITSLEGTPPKRVTVQQWDSLDALKAWYNGKDYH
jgi:uncharacterized protein (DUF1330 family)